VLLRPLLSICCVPQLAADIQAFSSVYCGSFHQHGGTRTRRGGYRMLCTPPWPQNIFLGDKDVMYQSVHRYDGGSFFPGAAVRGGVRSSPAHPPAAVCVWEHACCAERGGGGLHGRQLPCSLLATLAPVHVGACLLCW